MHANGTFAVELKPLTFDGATDDKQLGRLSLSKHFSGDLEADSAGEMLSAMTAFEGSAGYVAIERVTGTLQGRTGSFVLQHSGAMNRGAPTLSVTVVPDSGTGELEGISGHMQIDIRDGQHFYSFEYTLPVSEAVRAE